jgi:hypothetical protein
MAWVLTDKEYEAVIQMAAPARYEYLIKKVAENEVVWSLASDDGWVVCGDDEEHECFPVWPHSRYAEAYADDSWANTSPQTIDLSDWLEKWLPGLEKDNRYVAAFPTTVLKAPVVAPSRMKSDLLRELENYE